MSNREPGMSHFGYSPSGFPALSSFRQCLMKNPPNAVIGTWQLPPQPEITCVVSTIVTKRGLSGRARRVTVVAPLRYKRYTGAGDETLRVEHLVELVDVVAVAVYGVACALAGEQRLKTLFGRARIQARLSPDDIADCAERRRPLDDVLPIRGRASPANSAGVALFIAQPD